MAAPQIYTAYIGLGSNLASIAGTPEKTITAAFRSLGNLGEVTARSSLYETAPVGFADQPSFVNAVAVVRTQDSPEVLLDKLLQIERRFGRERGDGPLKGPRTLDLDLLMVDDLIVNTLSLSLPHPALTERRFVLVPLAEVAPETVHPGLGKTIRELLQMLPNAGENNAAGVQILRRNP
jgi:2-amino-4-hydroxy-6-hydroxymethyldihydropteridine diphosphokinase